MKTKTNRIFKIVSLLMVLSIFLSCEKNVKIESSFNQILNYDELKIQLENDADLQIIVSKINERQLA
ncbi:MAG: hypothetical protein R2822_20365 [Spirosomataceae bacterium]